MTLFDYNWDWVIKRQEGWRRGVEDHPDANPHHFDGPLDFHISIWRRDVSSTFHPEDGSDGVIWSMGKGEDSPLRTYSDVVNAMNMVEGMKALVEMGWEPYLLGSDVLGRNSRFKKGEEFIHLLPDGDAWHHQQEGVYCTTSRVRIADLRKEANRKVDRKAEYIRLAKSYDDKAFQVADEDSRRESPYGNQKAVKDHLDNADRFYEMAGTTREEQA